MSDAIPMFLPFNQIHALAADRCVQQTSVVVLDSVE